MLPLVPLLVILGTSFVYELSSRVDARGAIAAIAVLARCHSCAVDVVADQLCRCRSALDRFVDRRGEWRARGVRSLCRLPGNARTPWVRLTTDQGPCGHRWSRRICVYDRFDFSEPRKGSAAAFYRHLLSQPHLEVSNGRPTSGYFNPVLRIVALDGSVARLQKIAGDIRAAAPGLTVRLVEQPASNVQ